MAQINVGFECHAFNFDVDTAQGMVRLVLCIRLHNAFRMLGVMHTSLPRAMYRHTQLPLQV